MTPTRADPVVCPPVGNEEDAVRAWRGEMPLLAENPHGDRAVYWDPNSATVYKVDKVDKAAGRCRQANAREHANAELFAGRLGVPPTTLYAVNEDVVLAMPYYPHRLARESEGDEVKAALDEYFGDLDAHNMRKDAAGNVKFIDLVNRKNPPERRSTRDIRQR